MTAPLEIEFTVACPPHHAFEVWTGRISTWWPTSHSVTGAADLEVTLEPFTGGRIFERTPQGVEHDWGEVTVWEPPHRLGYLWHLMFDRSEATDVEISFLPDGEHTLVRIVHGGWDRLGEPGIERRRRNRQGWSGVITHYEVACAHPA